MPENHIHLQGIGKVPAVQASVLKVGDRLMWNYGIVNEITAIVDVSLQFLLVTEKNPKSGETHARRLKKTRLVARI